LTPNLINPYIIAPPATPYHCQSNSTRVYIFGNFTPPRTRFGVQFLTGHTVVNQTVTGITVYLQRTSSGSSDTTTYYVEIVDSSGSAVTGGSYGSGVVKDLTTSLAGYTFSGGSYQVQANDRLQVRASGTDYLEVATDDTGGETNTNWFLYNGSYADYTTEAFTYCVYT